MMGCPLIIIIIIINLDGRREFCKIFFWGIYKTKILEYFEEQYYSRQRKKETFLREKIRTASITSTIWKKHIVFPFSKIKYTLTLVSLLNSISTISASKIMWWELKFFFHLQEAMMGGIWWHPPQFLVLEEGGSRDQQMTPSPTNTGRWPQQSFFPGHRWCLDQLYVRNNFFHLKLIF